LQLRERLISTISEIDLDLDAAFLNIKTISSSVDIVRDPIASQADYISFLSFDNEDMDWNYLDADEDAEINLF
jgi:hypothetical protein